MKIEHTEGKVHVSLDQKTGTTTSSWLVEIAETGYGRDVLPAQRFEVTDPRVVGQLILALQKVASAQDALGGS